MSITSKIVLSALLVGITVPAFAQSGSVSVQKPAVTTHAARVHKVASATDVTKPDASKPGATVSTGTTASSGTTVNTGIVGSTKPAAKPELGKIETMKTDAPKASVTTSAAASTKPLAPAVSGSTAIAPKTN